MFSRPRNWLAGGLWKSKNPHSLEYLKYLYSMLSKNHTITENNRLLLIEILRCISEILIWGDQNDSTVFDFFLEKNMLSFFLRYLRQKSGRYICIQLLQTLNILFENISNETSLYYLLSNNHVNCIIVHKFDFSDEEVMAYYISFLKTLSLKLNRHTINFFYNEHTNDFALYTEAIKFFNHSESMVRIAVRTITLNVFRVDDASMLRYVRDKTAAPYFSNLVWFIGNHIIELDSCLRNDSDHQSRVRLSDLVAEHLDHLYYLNDIFCLRIDFLNDVLTDHLLNRLIIPLVVYSLTRTRHSHPNTQPHVNPVLSLFLLSQVYMILSENSLMRQLTNLIFRGDLPVVITEADGLRTDLHPQTPEFFEPPEPLAQSLENNRGGGTPLRRPNYRNTDDSTGTSPVGSESSLSRLASNESGFPRESISDSNTTDEEKLHSLGGTSFQHTENTRPYLEVILDALDCIDNDYEALFALSLLYSMTTNEGVGQELLDSVHLTSDKSESKDEYNVSLVERLIKIITLSCQPAGRVRLATLEMCVLLLKQMVYDSTSGVCYLQDRHIACSEGAKEEATLFLRNFFKSEEIFLDMFEDEYRERKGRPLNVEYLYMDASLLLPPTGTPLTGIEFSKRLPCGEVERARRAIRVYFILRDLSLTLSQQVESKLPLTKPEDCIKNGDILDLNNSDLIACTVILRDSKKEKRFLVIDVLQLILVEPDTKRLGWGIVRFVGLLQDVEVTGDKDDSRSLHVTVHKPSTSSHVKPVPLLAARFIFDDHIRCMAAKQRLTKGRHKARQRKMQMIARLLEFPSDVSEQIFTTSNTHYSSNAIRRQIPGTVQRIVQGQGQQGQRSSSREPGSSVVIVDNERPAAEETSPITIHEGRERTGTNSSLEVSTDVEEAVEAISPSAFAFQALGGTPVEKEDVIARQQRYINHSRSSSNGSTNSKNVIQEIPLEELSLRRKPRRSNSESETTGLKKVDEHRARSSSSSPLRVKGRSLSNPNSRVALSSSSTGSTSRSRSLSGDLQHRSRSSSQRSSIALEPHSNDLKTLKGRLLLVKARNKVSSDSRTSRNSNDDKVLRKRKSKEQKDDSLGCVPTLNTAQGLYNNIVTANQCVSQYSSSITNSPKPPRSLKNNASVEVSHASADLNKVVLSTETPGTASEQLNRLANSPQHHYLLSENEHYIEMTPKVDEPDDMTPPGVKMDFSRHIHDV